MTPIDPQTEDREIPAVAIDELPPPPWQPPDRVRLRRIDLAILLLILVATSLTYFARLSEPGPGPINDEIRKECKAHPTLEGAPCHKMIPLDEVHYVPDARDVVLYGTESDARVTSEDGAYVVHPPAGKWFIAAGIKLFGDRPFGWRFFGAVFGVIGVLVMYLIGLRLWRSPWWAALAASFLALDGLWFVLSRTAMLDIYVSAWFLTAVWLVLKDRDRPKGEPRLWLWLGGGALGMALASKLEIIWMFGVFVVLVLLWELQRRRREGGSANLGASILRWGVTMIVLPITVYIAAFTPWFLDTHRYNPPLCRGKHTVPVLQIGGRFGQWVCYQRQVIDFHRDLAKYDKGKPAHPYFTNAYTWPWVGRPVAHYYESTNAGTPKERRMEVLGLPNLAVWIPGFFIAFPLLGWWTLRRDDDTALFVFAMFFAGFVPNLMFDVVRRPVFLFYALPMVPFVVIGVTHMWWRTARTWGYARTLVRWHLAVAVLTFAYFYPVLAAWPLSAGGFFGWQGRIWENLDCSAQAVKRFCWI